MEGEGEVVGAGGGGGIEVRLTLILEETLNRSNQFVKFVLMYSVADAFI